MIIACNTQASCGVYYPQLRVGSSQVCAFRLKNLAAYKQYSYLP